MWTKGTLELVRNSRLSKEGRCKVKVLQDLSVRPDIYINIYKTRTRML